MARPLEVKEAAELLDSGFLAKWQERRALDPLARTTLRTILLQFVESGGPVRVEELAALLPAHDPGEVSDAIARLDEKDLIVVQEGRVIVAYPLAGIPTAFTVILPDGFERYAVCAIDALGVPAMLGQPVTIHSHCHHCREPLEIHAGPDGPIGSAEVMVWVGERGEPRSKSYTSHWPRLNFFRSEEHLRSWWEAHPDVTGDAAVLDEAFKVGAKIFGESLRDI